MKSDISSKRIPVKPSALTSDERKLYERMSRKIADSAVAQPWTSHSEQVVACCDFLIQEREGRI